MPETLHKSTELLSPTMRKCLADVLAWGGIERFPGGYWRAPRAAPMNTTERLASHGTSTVEALITRGLIVYTRWTQGRNGRFPTVAQLTDAGVAFIWRDVQTSAPAEASAPGTNQEGPR